MVREMRQPIIVGHTPKRIEAEPIGSHLVKFHVLKQQVVTCLVGEHHQAVLPQTDKKDRPPPIPGILERMMMSEFLFQGAEETLEDGIVITTALANKTELNSPTDEHSVIEPPGVLIPLVTMVHPPAEECRYCQAMRHASTTQPQAIVDNTPYTSRTIFPTFLFSSIYRWASAACLKGKDESMTGCMAPEARCGSHCS